MKTKSKLGTTCSMTMARHSRIVGAARLLPLLLLLTLPAVVQAQFNYTTDNGTITITGYTGLGGAVTIPSTINGLPVTRIGGWAFAENTSLTSVTIPDSVTTIGTLAFSSCISLTNVTIPNSVTRIGDNAFSSCISLTSVTLGNSVITIEEWAFGACTSLTSVTIPNSVTSIGYLAFSHCTSLTNVTIPNSVTSIGNSAFAGCTSLTAITVDALNSAFRSVDGVLFNKNQTTLIQYPGGKAGSYTIPNSVTSIGEGAFAGCTSLTGVTIPDSVTSIGQGAFSSCISLTGVTIGNSVTGLDFGTFSGCTSLTSVTIGNSVTSIEGDLPEWGIPGAFHGCTSLMAITVDALNSAYSSVDGVLFNKNQTTLIQYPAAKAGSYTIPNSVTSIGGGAFHYCTSLTSVTIPNSVTNIGYRAFSGCTSLTGVTIGNSVTNIGIQAFSYCTNLAGVYFQGNAPSVESSVFEGANKATVYYLPGTTGWGATFAGRPTAQWLPEARTTDADFGVRTNQFGFNIRWASDKVVVVEASPDLSNPVWTPVSTNTLTGGSSYFSDPQWTNHPTRFYRLRSP